MMNVSTKTAPAGTAALEPFVEAGVLGSAELHVASTLARLAPDEVNPEVLLATALAVRGLMWGHTCVEPATIAQTVAVDGGDPAHIEDLPWPDPTRWSTAIENSPIVGRPDVDEPDANRRTAQTHRGVVLPLIWDSGRLYLRRYWSWERAVANDLRTRAGHLDPFADADDAARAAVLDELFEPASVDGEVDLQRRAAESALSRSLTVVAGGPGTGKTRTVARLLAAMHELSPDRAPEIALAAPTGKAAARMTEAIRQELGRITVSEQTANALEQAEAGTIHRLLGSIGSDFRHNRRNPLGHDVVVIDETSMVSLPLMARLLDALRANTRLVLVGDPDQLASVEAGTVMGDVVGPPEIADPRGEIAHRESGLGDSVIRLQRTHRFGADSPIARLAGAIQAGDADRVAELLASDNDQVRRIDPDDQTTRAALIETMASGAVAVIRAAQEGDAEQALALLGTSRVLCSNRRGPDGVYTWATDIEEAVNRSGASTEGRWYPGRPVLVTRNDYLTRRRNGDVGVAVIDPARTQGRDDGLVVAFDDGEYVQPARLDEIETLWAMTIHKSQGSEFEDVVVVLPPPPSPILTRELLYTAVTRAKGSVTIVASSESVEACVKRPVSRSSGLRPALWNS